MGTDRSSSDSPGLRAETCNAEMPSGTLSAQQLMPLVYDQLRALAADYLRRERPDHTLQPTALVHEAYLRLVSQNVVDFNCRAHFFAIAARTIRRVLIDHSRARNAAKRGSGSQRITLGDASGLSVNSRELDLLALDEALNRLAWLHPRPAHVVELRFFGGLTNEEVARLLGVSRTIVAKDWALAKAWLSREISGEGLP